MNWLGGWEPGSINLEGQKVTENALIAVFYGNRFATLDDYFPVFATPENSH